MNVMPQIISALMTVESAGQVNPVGDSGAALGPLQIHECVVQDVNRIYGMKFRHEQVTDMRFARAIASLYLKHYMRTARLSLGFRMGIIHMSDAELAARIWNGGPKGYEKHATDAYWSKVKQHLPTDVAEYIGHVRAA